MTEIYLSYFSNNPKQLDEKKELELFFEYQNIIKDDLKRIRYLVSDYDFSKEKESLLFYLNNVIRDITRNKFEDDPEDELNIRVYENYLVFSYYKLDEEGITVLDTPSIVIITRDMKNIYFVDEVFSIFREEEKDDPYNRGYDNITYFKLDKQTIHRYDFTLEEYTWELFQLCFGKTEIFTKRFKNN